MSEPPPIDLRSFWDMCNQHDWGYEFSDDDGLFKQGKAEHMRLYDISKCSPQHHEMFRGFQLHKFSGVSWKTDGHPKPERP